MIEQRDVGIGGGMMELVDDDDVEVIRCESVEPSGAQ